MHTSKPSSTARTSEAGQPCETCHCCCDVGGAGRGADLRRGHRSRCQLGQADAAGVFLVLTETRRNPVGSTSLLSHVRSRWQVKRLPIARIRWSPRPQSRLLAIHLGGNRTPETPRRMLDPWIGHLATRHPGMDREVQSDNQPSLRACSSKTVRNRSGSSMLLCLMGGSARMARMGIRVVRSNRRPLI